MLLERGSLTGGTTWHAAGLIGRLRGSRSACRLVQASAELYARLPEETGRATGWKRCGSLVVARTAERVHQLRRSVALGRTVGIDAHLVGPDEVRRLWPPCRTDDLAGAMVVPDDGRVIPTDVTQALAAGARSAGAVLREGVAVTGVTTRGGAVAAVETREGPITCETVVNCTGLWARGLGQASGVVVPLWPVEHFYAVTRPIEGVSPDLAVLRDLDGCVYVREEVGGLLFGGFEPRARPWLADPPAEAFALLKERLGPERWFVVTGSAQRVRDLDWIRRHVPAGAGVEVTDETEAWATLGLVGPRAREVLARATDADLGNAAFPWGSVRDIAVAGVPVRAIRVSYAGELGWELYAPATGAGRVWDALMQAGDVVPSGYYALEGLRIEKGYRAWGRELTPDDTPLEAGLAFTVRLDKPGGFLGRDALVAQRARGLTRRLLLFALEDPQAVAWGDEPIWRDGAVVGTLTSAAYGHTLGRPVAMGYVACPAGAPAPALLQSRYEIDIAGTRVAAAAALRPWHDPDGARLRG